MAPGIVEHRHPGPLIDAEGLLVVERLFGTDIVEAAAAGGVSFVSECESWDEAVSPSGRRLVLRNVEAARLVDAGPVVPHVAIGAVPADAPLQAIIAHVKAAAR